MNDPHREWNENIRTALDAEAADIERRHADRLAEARAVARAAGTGRRRTPWTVLLPIAASVAVVALTAILLLGAPDAPAPMPRVADLDVLTSEAFDLAQDDIEFYAWLAEQDLDEARESSG